MAKSVIFFCYMHGFQSTSVSFPITSLFCKFCHIEGNLNFRENPNYRLCQAAGKLAQIMPMKFRENIQIAYKTIK